MTGTTDNQATAHTMRPTLWRSVLLGPMPLSYPLIAACAAYYLIGVALSLVAGNFDWQALPSYVWSPNNAVQVDLGNGGRAPLLVWQLWTLIDTSYLHLNLLHIGVNMFCLYQIMPAVEQGFGRSRAFSIYALAGIAGALASAIWGEFYSLGASGALFGLFGAVLVYGWLRRDEYGRYLMMFSLKWAGLNFAFGLLGPVAISNASHIGGFIGGALAAFALVRSSRRSRPAAGHLAGILFSLTLVCLAVGLGRATSEAWLAVSDPAAYEARQDDDLLAKTDAMLTLNPRDDGTRVQRAQARAGKGQFDAALKDIDDADNGTVEKSEIARNRAWIHAQRSQDYLKKGDYDTALKDIDAAIGGGVDTPGVHRVRGWLLAVMGRPGDALPEIETALRGNPDDPYAHKIRGHLHETMGNLDLAIDDYRAALRLDPTDENSRQSLKRLTEAQP